MASHPLATCVFPQRPEAVRALPRAALEERDKQGCSIPAWRMSPRDVSGFDPGPRFTHLRVSDGRIACHDESAVDPF